MNRPSRFSDAAGPGRRRARRRSGVLLLPLGLCAVGPVASIAGVRTGRANLTAPRWAGGVRTGAGITRAFAILEASFVRARTSPSRHQSRGRRRSAACSPLLNFSELGSERPIVRPVFVGVDGRDVLRLAGRFIDGEGDLSRCA